MPHPVQHPVLIELRNGAIDNLIALDGAALTPIFIDWDDLDKDPSMIAEILRQHGPDLLEHVDHPAARDAVANLLNAADAADPSLNERTTA